MVTDEIITPTARAASARPDAELLRLYADTGSDEVFAELVSRHGAWVYSAALRQLGNAASAQDVTQAVFIALARKAGSLRRETVLSGWLFRALRYAAVDAMRTEERRRIREDFASEHSDNGVETVQPAWHEAAPVLDECLEGLKPADQRAILLRFYERKTWSDVGAALGLRENTARVRVDRALTKLRILLKRRGVISSTSALVALLGAHAVNAAPAFPIVAALGPSAANVLAASVARRFLIQKLVTVTLALLLGITVTLSVISFRNIPLPQNLPPNILLGDDVFAAMSSIDRAFYDNRPREFLNRIFLPADATPELKAVLPDYVVAASEYRRAGVTRFKDPMFGYYVALRPLSIASHRPTVFGHDGKQATGAFAHNFGIYLTNTAGQWKWEITKNLTPDECRALTDRLGRKAALFRAITIDVNAAEDLTAYDALQAAAQ